MLFDSLMLAGITGDLRQALTSSRVRRVFATGPLQVAVETSAAVSTPVMVFGADAQFACVHLSGDLAPQPQQHSPFANVLRRYLRGTTLRSAQQIDFDRQLRLDFINCQNLGPQARCTLVVEIMGRHSNILLLDSDGIILDCIKHITSEVNRYRQSLPGLEYVPPPTFGKVDPRDLSASDFLLALSVPKGTVAADADAQMPFAKWFRAQFHGASDVLLSELASRAGWDAQATMSTLPAEWPEQLYEAFHSLLDAATAEPIGYIYASAEGKPRLAYPVPLISQPDWTVTRVDTLSGALEKVYQAQHEYHYLDQQRQRLRAATEKKLKQVTRRREGRQKMIEQAKSAAHYRQWGELILTHLSEIPPGAEEITVPDYYRDGQPPVTIPLDPHHTPQESAQYYFDNYKRARRCQQQVPALIRRDRREQQYLQGLMHQTEIADTSADLAELEQEMIKAGYLPSLRRRRPAARRRKLPTFVTDDGYTVIYGKTGQQNEEVLRVAAGDDIWLHVRQGPGAHVVIRSGGQPDSVPESALLQAARHAAALSRQATSSGVEVSYTLVKHVRKPRGSPPGFVRYTNFKTLRVRPQRAFPSNTDNSALRHPV